MTRPNILFFFPDQHRGDWLGAAGTTGVRTPNLDRLAATGARYTRAMTPSPLCSPARACLAAGRRYDDQDVRSNRDDFKIDAPNIYRTMRDAGYTVMGCGKFDLLKDSMDWGADGMHGSGQASRIRRLGFSAGCDSAGKHDCITAFLRERGDEPYRAYLQSLGLWDVHLKDFAARSYSGGACYTNVEVTPLPDDAYCDNWIGATGLRLLREAPADDPWFLQVNFNGPHEPLDVTAAMQRRWDAERLPDPIANTQYGGDEHQAMRRNYAAMIENIDRMVGEYLEWLSRTGRLGNTLVVYSSDHGDNLGDHDKWHKTTPQQGSVGVPMILGGPGVTPGTFGTPVDLVDLSATFLTVSESDPGQMAASGYALTDGAPDRPLLTSGFGEWRLITDGRYKYVHNYDPHIGTRDRAGIEWDPRPDAIHQLFDLATDPSERHDIASREVARCAAMHGELTVRVGAGM